MAYSVFPDFGIGLIIIYWDHVAPILLIIPVILVERAVLKEKLHKERALLYAFIVNVVSTAIGFVSAMSVLERVYKFTKFILDTDPDYGSIGEVLFYWTLCIGATCLLSVGIEGVILTALEFKRAPIPKIWWATLIANIASYATMVGLTIVAGIITATFFN